MDNYNYIDYIYSELSLLNDIYTYLSTISCEYVDNLGFEYKNSNSIKNPQFMGINENINEIENIKNIYENITNYSNFYNKIGGFYKNTQDVVDNIVNNGDNFQLIHKNFSFSENNINPLENNTYNLKDNNVNEYFEDFVSNVSNFNNEKLNNSFSPNYDINISLGGITQNINKNSNENIVDILTEKLVEALNSCGDGVYF